MCINFNQLALRVSDIRRKKGKVENKMSQEYMSGALKLRLVHRIAIPLEKMNSSYQEQKKVERIALVWYYSI